MNKKAFFAALFSTFIWATTFSLSKMVLQYPDGTYKLGIFPYLSIRFVLGLGVLYAAAIKKGKLKLLGTIYRKNKTPVILTGIVGIGLAYISQFISLRYTTSVNQSVILQTQTFFIIFISAIVYKNRIKPSVYTGCLLSFTGYLLIVMNSSFSLRSEHLMGDLFCLIPSVCWAVFTGVGGEIVSRNDSLSVLVLVESIGAMCIFPLVLFSPYRDLGVLRLVDWGALVWMGGMGVGLAYLTWYYALTMAKPHEVGLILYFTPVFSFILGYFLLGEEVTLLKLASVLFITAGVYIAERK